MYFKQLRKKVRPIYFKPLSIILINIAIISMITMHFIPNQQTEAQTTVDHTIIEQLKIETAKQNQIQQNKQQAITKQLVLKKQHELKRLAEEAKQQTAKTENIEEIKQQTAKTENIEEVKQQTAKTENIEEVKQQTAKTENIEKANTTSIQTVKEEPQKNIQPINVRTDGFNFNSYHYDIRWFSGSRFVPADQYIYQWAELPNHYLIEKNGQAGNTIWTIKIGTQIIINGQTYTCYKILNHVKRLDGYDILINEHATISAQTCETNLGNLVTFWFFK